MGKRIITAGYGYGYGYGHALFADGSVDAWHICKHDTIRDHGGVRLTPEVGLVLQWHGPIQLCRAGLHASLGLADARKYADGVVCRVRCSGDVIFGIDKLVCSRREILEVFPRGYTPET